MPIAMDRVIMSGSDGIEKSLKKVDLEKWGSGIIYQPNWKHIRRTNRWIFYRERIAVYCKKCIDTYELPVLTKLEIFMLNLAVILQTAGLSLVN
jgi:hypothetical protein